MNPILKKGDLAIMVKSHNQRDQWVNIVCEVVTAGTNPIVKSVSGVPAGQTNFYNANPADEFILADRKEQAKYIRKKNKELIATVESNKQEIIRLERFDSEEDYVAYKIDALLKAKGVKAKAQVLRELKKSNFI